MIPQNPGSQPSALPPTLPPDNSAAPPSAAIPGPRAAPNAQQQSSIAIAVQGTPLAAVAPMPGQYGREMPVPPTLVPGTPAEIQAATTARAQGPQATPPPSAAASACPRCGAVTPAGFMFCQACGFHIQAVAPTDPGASAQPRAGGSQPGQPLPTPQPSFPAAPQGSQPGIDPQGATLAAPSSAPVPGVQSTPRIRPPTANGAVQWGTAVLVNRDGSDGDRHKLDAEFTVIGRGGADIAFEDDRFLARQHARLERNSDGTVYVTPTDALNGVFRKTDAPVELVDGAVILVGREVLRFEKVDVEERVVTALVRHGVAMFGSPPREPWGRLLQILPSGGYRDIRHLMSEEVVLGREEGDIVFRDDAFMSRRHAALNWDGARAMLTDLGSSNGTFVRLAAKMQLKHGDHLRLGDQLLRIELGR
jgi:pSer/pThr/pTyr-binding forkhead associated (FHA) protein